MVIEHEGADLVGFNVSCHWDYVNRQVSAFNCLPRNIEILMMTEKCRLVLIQQKLTTKTICSVKAVKNT